MKKSLVNSRTIASHLVAAPWPLACMATDAPRVSAMSSMLNLAMSASSCTYAMGSFPSKYESESPIAPMLRRCVGACGC